MTVCNKHTPSQDSHHPHVSLALTRPKHETIDIGAFLALQAKRVSWSTLAWRPQLNRVHTVNVNAADIPSFVQNFAGKWLKFIPVVKPQCFFQLHGPDPEARLVRWLWTIIMLVATCAQVGMFARFGAVCGVRSCRLLLKQAFIPYVRVTRTKARANMASDACGRTNRSFAIPLFFGDKKALHWLRCNRWVPLIDTDKNLGTALVESQWIEDQVQIWLNKITRHFSEAEASHKIIAGAPTLEDHH